MNRSLFREGRLYLSLAVLTMVLAGADALYFLSIEPPAPAPEAPVTSEAPLPAAPTMEAALADTMLVCSYNPEIPAVTDVSTLVGAGDVIEGNPQAPVTVVEFFEPNCPHCRNFYPVMKQAIATYGEAARFVVKPVIFWDKSVVQGQALYAAMAEGKYDQMLAAQFATAKPNGLTEADVRAIATRIGMDPDVMMRRIGAGEFRPAAYQARQAFQASGNKSVPAVLINGRTVSHESRTAACIGKLIAEASVATQ